MKTSNQKDSKFFFMTLGWILLSGLVACSRKSDPAATNAAGTTSQARAVLTVKGAIR